MGYNYINTLTYGVVFVLILMGINKILQRFKIPFTYKTAISLVPFVFLGATIRVLEDAGALPKTFLLVTPSIYILMIALTALVFLISRKTKNPDRTVFVVGLGFWLLTLSSFKLRNPTAFAYIFGIYAGVIIFLYLVRKTTGFLRDSFDFSALGAHFLDATATFVTLDLFSNLGYFEQHPLTRLIGTLGGSYVWFYVAKLYVLVVLYFINKDVEDKNFRNLLKFAVLILGLGPGLRDTLRLSMGV